MPIRRSVSREEKLARRQELAKEAANGMLALPGAIRQCREALGLTQQEFAVRFGLTRLQVSHLETGRSNPTQETLMKIGAPFGFTLGFVPRKQE
jgi:putative transcriptional regulator